MAYPAKLPTAWRYRAAALVLEQGYRRAADTILAESGIHISHQAIWKICRSFTRLSTAAPLDCTYQPTRPN
jgi:hypothetical protein